MRTALKTVLAAIVLLSAVWLTGPRAESPLLDPTPIRYIMRPEDVAEQLRETEARHPSMKPGNEAGVIWADDSVRQTEFAVVFLHGFTASKMEGRPVTTDFAKEFGMNLYEARLYGHGLDTADALIDLTAERLVQTAKEAVAIGKVMGRKVILISSSTGGTLSLYLAAHDTDIAALFCYSPNIEIGNPAAKFITGHWGMPIARLVSGGDTRSYDASDDFKRHWQTTYRLEGVLAVQSLVEATMTAETFERIRQPVFVGCYFKNEEEQDPVVSVEAMRNMMPLLATKEKLKRLVEFPNAGAHVITSPFRSGDVEGVMQATRTFASEVMGLRPVKVVP